MYEEIVAILAEQLQIDPAKIAPDTGIVDALGADSLDVVEIIMALESRFGIMVPDEEIEEFRTPTDIQNHILAKTQNK